MLQKQTIHENIDSAVSYGMGGFAYIIASLPTVADTAQHIAIILGCLVVVVRLAHDTMRFLKFLRTGKEPE